jgi:hypothetical protein
MKEIFGEIDGNGKVREGNGLWWPIHTVNHSKLNNTDSNNTPYPNSHLSALMIASGDSGNIVFKYNYEFPPINSGVPIITTYLDDEARFCDVSEPKIGECSGTPNRPYWEPKWYSIAGLSNQPSWPLYGKNTLYVHNYITTGLTSGKLPTSIDIQMIFPGAYPNRDTGINGIILCKALESTVCNGRSITGPDGRVYGISQYVKPTLYEKTEAFLDCGLQRNYSAWYYKFNKPQNKYEDQMINLFLTFGVDRI